LAELVTRRTGLRRCDGAKVKEGRLIQERKKSMKKIIAEEIFRRGECKLKAGSLSIGRMTLDTGRLSCGFDSGTASDGTLKMRMLCTDPEDKQSSMYGAQLKLLPGKKIELIIEPMDQQ